MQLSNIIEKIKKIKNLHTDVEVAIMLGIRPTTLSAAKTRNNIPYAELFQFCEKEKISSDIVFDLAPMPGEEKKHIQNIKAEILVMGADSVNAGLEEILKMESLYNKTYFNRIHINVKEEKEKPIDKPSRRLRFE